MKKHQELPPIGLGTWELRGEECVKVVQAAIELGYRHIDTAHVYDNHAAIAKAIKNVDRSQLYLTSKLALEEQIDPSNVDQSVQKACEKALRELKVDYIDLYLIHAPNRSYPLEEIFRAMTKLVEQKKVDQVGVSNYTMRHLEDLAKADFTPFANQVELHPYLNQQALLDYCHKHQIKVISYRPFGKGKLLKQEPLFDEIGAKYNKSGAQVILRWLIQKEIPVVPKASSEQHLKENLEIFDFSLNDKDMAAIDQLHRDKRYCNIGDQDY